jgi:hypothetical protein
MLRILGVLALTDAGGGMAPPFEVYLEQQSDAAPKFFTDFDSSDVVKDELCRLAGHGPLAASSVELHVLAGDDEQAYPVRNTALR